MAENKNFESAGTENNKESKSDGDGMSLMRRQGKETASLMCKGSEAGCVLI